jgi:hypothetical protein
VIRVLRWALVIFFLWYMVTSPEGAAAWVHDVLGWIAHAGSSLSAFVDSLLESTSIVAAVLIYLASRLAAGHVHDRNRMARRLDRNFGSSVVHREPPGHPIHARTRSDRPRRMPDVLSSQLVDTLSE